MARFRGYGAMDAIVSSVALFADWRDLQRAGATMHARSARLPAWLSRLSMRPWRTGSAVRGALPRVSSVWRSRAASFNIDRSCIPFLLP